MKRGGIWSIALVALSLAAPNSAQAQGVPAGWSDILEKAKTETLVMHNQGNAAFDAVVEAFTKKFGIKVDVTVSRPSQALTRVQLEQKNGSYLGDVWWAITGLMTTVAAPTGMFEPIGDYLRPEIKDVSVWRDPEYIYGDPTHFVFTYNHEVNPAVYRNHAVLPQVKVTDFDSLMNPQLKGKIVVREASYANAGSYALAPMLNVKGADFLANFLKQQDPRVFDNPKQLDKALISGAAAVEIGGQAQSYSQCRTDGGCQTIDSVPAMATTISRGFAVFKHAPHPEAVKVWLNWILSKEGQELLVKEWAKANTSGAVSMRKDVAPAPGHEQDLPDFKNANQYDRVSTQRGNEDIKKVTKIFKEWNSR
jgi:iron(III) transport system substrate-binding protein